MKNKNFERSLPDGYNRIFRIDANDSKVGLLMNLAALGIAAVITAIMLLIPYLMNYDFDSDGSPMIYLLFLPIYIVYIILHELTHGAAYKITTGEKLTFGITISVAFCGVPNIFVYRKAAIFAAISPFLLFSIIFGGLCTAFYFINAQLYILFTLIFAFHVGGCIGDLYWVSLLTFKYKDNTLLVSDTGPEQSIYAKI